MNITPGIQPRGNSFLVDVSVAGKRRRVTCATLEEAQSTRARLSVSLQSLEDKARSGDAWTIGEAFERVTALVWTGTAAQESSTRNGQAAVDFFGAKTPLDDITGDWVDGWIARLRQTGNANATINRKLAALSKIITFAHQRGKVKAKPYLQRQEESKGRVRFLTQEEEVRGTAFLAQWAKDDHVEVLTVLIDSGLRPSELWKLESRDLDFTQGLMTIWQTKNKEPRSVPMTQRVQDIMRRRKEFTATGPLFPFDNYWFGYGWDRMKSAMGLDQDTQFIPYALRHTCASRLVQRGVNLRVVQEWMGHKTISVTMRYAHLSPANLLDAVKVLEAC